MNVRMPVSKRHIPNIQGSYCNIVLVLSPTSRDRQKHTAFMFQQVREELTPQSLSSQTLFRVFLLPPYVLGPCSLVSLLEQKRHDLI